MVGCGWAARPAEIADFAACTTQAGVYDDARDSADAMGEAIGLDPMRVNYGVDLASNLGGLIYGGGGSEDEGGR